KESRNRAGTRDYKEKKVEDDKETAELKQRMEIIPDEEEVAIDIIPLASNHMLKSFNKEDLEDLYKLVKAKYESTRPVEDLYLILWGDLKTMFEPHVEDKGRIVGIKSLTDTVWITAAHVCVNAAQLELVLLRDFKENMLNCSAEVNAARENMLEVTTASEYQVNTAS
ncbi:hypothetical protein Tco_1486428, partial [Tanacetum coccineum]